MIPGLDGLRAIAFLMVFLTHTGHLPIGWAGVELFFVLSGFLITDILLRMKEKLPRREFFIKFYGRRVLRIFPLQYFYLFLTVLLIYYLPTSGLKGLRHDIGENSLQQVWIAFFYLYNFFSASSFFTESRFFSHLWSLAVEEQFYLVWPLLIFIIPREKFKRLTLASIGLGIIFRLAIVWIYQHDWLPYLRDDPLQAVYVLPFSHLDAFAFGAYISRFEIPRPRLQLAAATLLIAIVGISTDLFVEGTITPAFGYAFPMGGFYKEIWGYTLLNYFFMLLIYNVARGNFFTAILESPPLRYLGKISYGLYVYHFGMIALTKSILVKYQMDYPVSSANFFVIALAANTLVASLSFYLLEKPLINLKDKLFKV